MAWSQVFSYVFPSFAYFYALDSSHSDGIALAQNFQCVSCKLNFFNLFFSKNAFLFSSGCYPVYSAIIAILGVGNAFYVFGRIGTSIPILAIT